MLVRYTNFDIDAKLQIVDEHEKAMLRVLKYDIASLQETRIYRNE